MHRVMIDGDGPNVIDGKIVPPEITRRAATVLA